MNSHFDYLANLGPLELAGVCGFLIYLLVFSAVQFSVLNGNSAAYSFFNVLAASLVALSLLAEFNLSSALIQASWILIGLLTGGALVFYFRDAPTLAGELMTGTAPAIAYLFLGIFSL